MYTLPVTNIGLPPSGFKQGTSYLFLNTHCKSFMKVQNFRLYISTLPLGCTLRIQERDKISPNLKLCNTLGQYAYAFDITYNVLCMPIACIHSKTIIYFTLAIYIVDTLEANGTHNIGSNYTITYKTCSLSIGYII